MRAASSENVSVAIHEFGGSGKPLLMSHATGFHGYCYLPIADELTDRFETYGIDYRGHGDTARPEDWQVDWIGYGDDAGAATRTVAPNGGLTGFGHSMGGAALLMAAHHDPNAFELLVLFEPIVFPPMAGGPDESSSPLVEGARRRRSSFDSFGAAIKNYSSKPPMMLFDPDVLRLYVAHGFRTAPEGIRIKCDPEHEARTFETAGAHQTWDLLPEIETPVVVVTGAVEDNGPSRGAKAVAERLTNGRYIENPEWNHFTPFIDPAAMANVIAKAAG